MAGFILGAAIALVVGMRLARHVDGHRGARADYRKATKAVPGARKKAYAKTFGFVRFIVVVALIMAAAAYGWMRHSG